MNRYDRRKKDSKKSATREPSYRKKALRIRAETRDLQEYARSIRSGIYA